MEISIFRLFFNFGPILLNMDIDGSKDLMSKMLLCLFELPAYHSLGNNTGEVFCDKVVMRLK